MGSGAFYSTDGLETNLDLIQTRHIKFWVNAYADGPKDIYPTSERANTGFYWSNKPRIACIHVSEDVEVKD